VSLTACLKDFMSPTARMSQAERSTLRAQRVRRNACRISTVAEGEQNWRRMLIWVRNENRLQLQFIQC